MSAVFLWRRMGTDNKYAALNEMQRRAVFQTEGPVLILAGAGSGKTRVLTHRMAYLIEEIMVPSYHILAITFTNKAAKEMKERVEKLIGDPAREAWISTFHSACIRILRRHCSLLGYTDGFTIYDPEDQKNVIRRLLREMNINEKMFTPRSVLGAISHAKDELVTPSRYDEIAKGDLFKEKVAVLYHRYQKALLENQAMDFDDIIAKTVALFEQNPEILEYYQEKFRYIMVDEYQDTNTAQYRLIRLLANKYENLCVVGDDDQSIYRFRGANIRNILDFEKDYQDACVIRLEENYRSTQTILDAANAVIAHNVGRKSKTLWTQNETGDPIRVYEAYNEEEEANYVAEQIIQKVSGKTRRYIDMAILFRTNAQSRALEERMIMANIPYRLYGGTPFYQRMEIKDILCYLRLIANDKDYVAAERILNVPKRGIGTVTVEKLRSFAVEQSYGITEAIEQSVLSEELRRASKKLSPVGELFTAFRGQAQDVSLTEFIPLIMEKVGDKDYLREEDPERYEDRIQNLDEFVNRAAEYEETAPEPSLGGFLEELALVAAIDSFEEGADAVSMMTLHSAKGLEFPVVFMTGMEDGIFPGYMSLTSGDEEDIEEERRLCYVGITRAQKELYMTYAKIRRVHGLEQISKVSQFMREIPMDLLEEEVGKMEQKEEGPVRKFVKTPEVHFQNRYVGKNVAPPVSQPGGPGEGFAPGDLVTHRKFGLGTVKEVQSVNADYQVKVNFVKVGEKTLFAKLAGIKKVEE